MTINESFDQETRRRRSWKWLFEGHPSVTDPGEIRKVRLLLIATFILSGSIGLMVTLLMALAPPEIEPYLPVLIGSVVVNILAYGLGRTRLYRLAFWLLLVGLAATGYSLIPLRPTDVVDQISSTIPIAFVLASILFTIPELIIFVVLNSLTIGLMPVAVKALETPLMVAQATIYLILGSITMTVTILRNNTERDRVLEVEKANDALRSIQMKLEERISIRTVDLVKKTSQLRASAEVARRAANIRNLNELLSQVAKLIADQFNLYHVGIFLTTEENDYAVLEAVSSEGGKKMLERGHRLRVGREGIVGSAIQARKARIIANVGKSAEYFNNPELPNTRAEMALPLILRDRVIGALDLQSSETGAFSENDLDTFQTMADQIALAIENARLLSESDSIIQQLQSLMAQNAFDTWKDRAADKKVSFSYAPLGITSRSKKSAQEIRDIHLLEIPIQLRGQAIGRIKLNRYGNKSWTERERSMVTELAIQVGLAIENARLLEEAEQRASHEQLIGEITGRATQTLDIENILQQIVRDLGVALDAPSTFVQIGLSEPANRPRE